MLHACQLVALPDEQGWQWQLVDWSSLGGDQDQCKLLFTKSDKKVSQT